MANYKQLKILKEGASAWNNWRYKYSDEALDLSGANLSGIDLTGAILSHIDFSGADLSNAILERTTLLGADLCNVTLSGAYLSQANFMYALLNNADLTGAELNFAILDNANLSGADLSTSNLTNAVLRDADLTGARLRRATLIQSTFVRTILSDTEFDDSIVAGTTFGEVDLRRAKGLELVKHQAPSNLSIDAIYASEGLIPEAFLLGCGVPESFIAQISALVGAVRPIQFHSCFISYSKKDGEFATRLHARMRQARLRVWFAPEDIKGGKKLYEQINRAIQVYDRLLLVLSGNSMKSEWVMTEIRRARKTEVKEGRRKLFPIRLVDYDAVREWECFDADSGKDLAVEVREYYIPDFSNWKNHDDFEREFNHLYESLKAEA
jgi:uncharacterized protein YjbI with pentapeptide repeats